MRPTHWFAATLPLALAMPAFAQGAPTVPPAATSPAVPSSTATDAPGDLQVSVLVVDDLTPKPVPYTYFTITSASDTAHPQLVKTDEQGKIDLPLPPGVYTVQNQKPLTFKNHSYVWKGSVTITSGQTSKLVWTDADAVTEVVKPARQISDEAAIYNLRKSAVVTVEGNDGSGSGFVVDPSGLILTNAHVVNGGRWAAIRFDRGLRFPAEIVEKDTAADVAVLRVNPAAYAGFTSMPLADPAAGPLAVEGEKVLTIGSPLNQEKILTIGIVSKVENDYLISDVNINHGNSGGPLINLAGDAIGLTTFLDSPTNNGPGISGIVAITKALPVLARARQKIAMMALPSAEMLPDISTVPIPQEALTAYKLRDVQPYTEDKPKNFETLVVTPFMVAAAQSEYDRSLNGERGRRLRKRGSSGDKDDLQAAPAAFWERYALHEADPVVWILVRPVVKEKSSSMWAGALGAAAGVRVKKRGEFRDDFYDMALYRGDTLVHPVRRAREKVSALYDGLDAEINDNAYGGIYFYDPSAFAPGAKLTLYVRRESDLTRWDVVPFKENEQAKIYARFLPYRTALAQAQGDTASLIVQGLSTTVHSAPIGNMDWDPDTGYTLPQSAPAAISSLASEASSSASTVLASVPAIRAPLSSPASPPPSSVPVPSMPPTPVAPPIPVAPPAPCLPEIKTFPQRVRIEQNDGNSFFGTVTAFDGTAYSVTTSSGMLSVKQADVKTLELL